MTPAPAGHPGADDGVGGADARTGVVMHPLPKGIPTMPNPCAGVPANAWCPAGRPV